jgi:hypothetical protein
MSGEQFVDPMAGVQTGQSQNLSSWAAPYVTDMLGKGQALSNMPFTAYSGPLTAGQSGLQNTAFQGLANLTTPTNMGTFNPQSFTGTAYTPPTAAQAAAGETGTYTPGMSNTVQQYMTPYLEAALQPQYDAANRQALIAAQNLQKQYGKAGAYGGSRQGVAEAELQRGLLDRMSGITGQGYQQAFTQGLGQFNVEQNRAQQAQNLANQYGFDVLGAQQTGGGIQRGIEGEGIAADYGQFREERDYPLAMTKYQKGLIEGLPMTSTDFAVNEPAGYTQVLGGIGGILKLLQDLRGE